MNREEYMKAYAGFPKKSFVSDFPLSLDISLTNLCNRHCSPCPYHGDNPIFKQDPCSMNFHLYRKIIDEGAEKGLESIKINYDGEPLLYKRIVDAVKYAKDSGIRDIRINTNGDCLDKEMSMKLLDAGLTTLILSDYGDHIQLLNGIVFSVVRLNYDCEFHVNKTNRPEIWRPISERVDPPIYYDFSNMIDNIQASDFKCTYPWLRMLVLADGTCMACSCGSITTDQILGNVLNQSIAEMWHSKKMRQLRFCHDNGFSHHISFCRKCGIRNDYIEKGECRR